jgi:peptidoglycan/xylan/chitin deacetylase (PgdA/CDA1 family)
VTSRLVISLDFELHWGVHDLMSVDGYRRNLLGAREAVVRMLDVFVERGIRVTWATVGMLFCEDRDELMELIPSARPTYRDERLSPYHLCHEIGRNERDDPFHFAPSLVRQIADAPGQELATHTFSHFYCLAPGQREDQFRSDLRAAKTVAARRGLADLRSIVFPRNQVNPGYLHVCAEEGLTAYRGTPSHYLYAPRDLAKETPLRRLGRLVDAYLPAVPLSEAPQWHPDGILDVPATRYLSQPRTALRAAERLRVTRVRRDIRRAAARGGYVHLWWHPHDFGYEPAESMRELGAILDEYERAQHEFGMTSVSMADLAPRGDLP